MTGSGLAAQVVQIFSLRAASMRRMIRSWELVLRAGSAPRASRELVAALVSRLNRCDYCTDAHEAFLAAVGADAHRAETLLATTAPDATPLERALVTLVRRAYEAPASLEPAVLAALRRGRRRGARLRAGPRRLSLLQPDRGSPRRSARGAAARPARCGAPAAPVGGRGRDGTAPH